MLTFVVQVKLLELPEDWKNILTKQKEKDEGVFIGAAGK